MTPEGDPQDAGTDTVQRGVFVDVAQVGQAHQRVGITQNAAHHVGDDLGGELDVEFLVPVYVIDHVPYGFAGIGLDLPGMDDFLLQRRLVLIGPAPTRCFRGVGEQPDCMGYPVFLFLNVAHA